MNFDDRFLSLLNMMSMGGMGGNQNPTSGQNQGMNFDGIMKIMGLMQGLQGSKMGANTNQGQNPSGGLDIMKILPLLSALKGGNPFGNMNYVNMQGSADVVNNAQHTYESPTKDNNPKTQCGYKDKYSAISFAGNEVIYTLGKLWKTYKA